MNKLSLKVILFGFIFTFFSSFGQSYFIGLFNTSIREELGISYGTFASIYATATILSSLSLIWIGKKIDDYNLKYYALFVVILLGFATLFFSFVHNLIFLFFGIYLLRLSGQGLMSHTATTTVSRYFETSRGKALSTTWFGLSTAEFILPSLIVFLVSFFYWRAIWQVIALMVVIFLPLIIFLTVKDLTIDSRESNIKEKINLKVRQWTRTEILKDYRFYVVVISMLAMPAIATGIFVNQQFISESKNWDNHVIPTSFMFYSISSLLTLFLSGYLVDKFTSRKLIPLINLPLLGAMLVLMYFDVFYSSFFFLGLVGISNGLANVLGSSTWAEIYGVKFIGGIKSLTTSLMVFSTAFGTAIFGLLIDVNFTIEQISFICAIFIVFSIISIVLIRDKLQPEYQN